MAKSLRLRLQRSAALSIAAGALACMPLLASGQALMDPTRPAGSASSSAAEMPAPRDRDPVLQSVVIAPGRTFATIDGKDVKVGDMVGKGRVIRIAENEVALQAGKQIQILKLFPEVVKRRGAGAAGDRSVRGN